MKYWLWGCWQDAQLQEQYERRDYDVSVTEDSSTDVALVPNSVFLTVRAPMRITQGDNTQTFNSFDVLIPSNMYNILMIATSIVDYEATYGDSATDLYLAHYPNIVIEKNTLIDGSTVYMASDITTKEKFTFASRSLAWPAGYGFEQ